MLFTHIFIMRANILNVVNNKIVATFDSINQRPTEMALSDTWPETASLPRGF